jgi:SAM-dependent methyltransferase
MGAVEAHIARRLGRPVSGLRMLEIGPGQRQRQQAYFAARGNSVLGVDLDVIPQGYDVRAYLEMLRTNGGVRTVKTLGRKLLGLDTAYQRELMRQLGVTHLPRLPVRQMDATRLELESESFDAAVSFSALEHFPEPGAAIAEVVRVLRPGGVAYLSLHLYTSDNGIHDARIFAGDREGIPLWAHLRPAQAHLAQRNAYLNELRLPQWLALFAEHLPGADIVRLEHDRAWQAPQLAELRAAGELAEYTDDELFTVDLAAVWTKPG